MPTDAAVLHLHPTQTLQTHKSVIDMSHPSTQRSPTQAHFHTNQHTDRHSHTFSHLHSDAPLAHDLCLRLDTNHLQSCSISDSGITVTFPTSFRSALGQTQNFHLISPGNNVHQLVLTDAAGVTMVMRKRAPFDTDLTAPPDTTLSPTSLGDVGRESTHVDMLMEGEEVQLILNIQKNKTVSDVDIIRTRDPVAAAITVPLSSDGTRTDNTLGDGRRDIAKTYHSSTTAHTFPLPLDIPVHGTRRGTLDITHCSVYTAEASAPHLDNNQVILDQDQAHPWI